MNCREFEKNIKKFIIGDLPDQKFHSFKTHYDVCKDCREELDIIFLIEITLEKEDDGQTYNLSEEIDRYFIRYGNDVLERYKSNFVKGAIIFSAEVITVTCTIYSALRFFIF